MELVRGQRAKLSSIVSDASFELGLRIAGLNGANLQSILLLLDADERLLDSNGIVADPKNASVCGTILHKKSGSDHWTWKIDLNRAPKWLKRIRLALSIESSNVNVPVRADAIGEGVLEINEDSGPTKAAYRFAGAHFGKESAITIADIYLYNDEWRVGVIGAGSVHGLVEIVKNCGGSPSFLEAPAPRNLNLNPKQKPAASTSVWPPSPPQPNRLAPVAPSAPLKPSRPAVGPGSEAVTAASVSPSLPVRLPTCWPGRLTTPCASEESARATGLVIADLANGLTVLGTGFAITPGGHFLCCLFTIQEAVKIGIQFDGTNLRRPAKPLAIDPASGLALCWISDRMGVADWLAVGDLATPPRSGDELGIVGFPLSARLGDSARSARGTIRSVPSADSSPRFSFDAENGAWMEGNPVIRRSDSKVIGVVTRGRTGSQSVATDLRAIQRLGWLALPAASSAPPTRALVTGSTATSIPSPTAIVSAPARESASPTPPRMPVAASSRDEVIFAGLSGKGGNPVLKPLSQTPTLSRRTDDDPFDEDAPPPPKDSLPAGNIEVIPD